LVFIASFPAALLQHRLQHFEAGGQFARLNGLAGDARQLADDARLLQRPGARLGPHGFDLFLDQVHYVLGRL
jgi:hypothetical protein